MLKIFSLIGLLITFGIPLPVGANPGDCRCGHLSGDLCGGQSPDQDRARKSTVLM